MSTIMPIQSVSHTVSNPAVSAIKNTAFGAAAVDGFGDGIGLIDQIIIGMHRDKKAMALDAKIMMTCLNNQLSNQTISPEAAVAKFARLSEICKSLPKHDQRKLMPVLNNLKSTLNTMLQKPGFAQKIYNQATAMTQKIKSPHQQHDYYNAMKSMILSSHHITPVSKTKSIENTSKLQENTKTLQSQAVSASSKTAPSKPNAPIQATEAKTNQTVTLDAIKKTDSSQKIAPETTGITQQTHSSQQTGHSTSASQVFHSKLKQALPLAESLTSSPVFTSA